MVKYSIGAILAFPEKFSPRIVWHQNVSTRRRQCQLVTFYTSIKQKRKLTKKNALEICGNYDAKLPDSLEAIKALSNRYKDGSFWAGGWLDRDVDQVISDYTGSVIDLQAPIRLEWVDAHT